MKIQVQKENAELEVLWFAGKDIKPIQCRLQKIQCRLQQTELKSTQSPFFIVAAKMNHPDLN